MFRLLLLVSLLCIPLQAFATDQWTPTKPSNGDSPQNWPTDEQANNNSLTRILYNYHQGQFINYSSATALSMSAGEVTCNSATPIVFRQNTSSTTINSANLDTGASFSISTTYYIYANCDASATTNTFTISLSSSAPSGVTNYKLLGQFTTDSSGNIGTIINTIVQSSTFSSITTGLIAGNVYQAATDGFIYVYGQGSSGGGAYLSLFSDSSNPPTTQVWDCQASTSFVRSSTTRPIKAGNYYKLVNTGGASLMAYEFWPK